MEAGVENTNFMDAGFLGNPRRSLVSSNCHLNCLVTVAPWDTFSWETSLGITGNAGQPRTHRGTEGKEEHNRYRKPPEDCSSGPCDIPDSTHGSQSVSEQGAGPRVKPR